MATTLTQIVDNTGSTSNILQDVWDSDNSGLDVFVQSNTNPPFQYWLVEELFTDRVLTSPTVPKSNQVVLNDVTDITVGHCLSLFENTLYEQVKIIAIDVGTKTLTTGQAISFAFSTSASVIIGQNNIASNTGTLETPVLYKYEPRQSAVPIDISLMIITITSGNNVPSDDNFGGIAPLSNGVYLYRENAVRLNLGDYFINGDFKDRGGSVTYVEKLGGGGVYTTDVVFNTATAFDSVIRVNTANESIVLESRDPLAGITSMKASIIGSFTTGEV